VNHLKNKMVNTMAKEKIVWKQFGPRIPNTVSKHYMKELPKKVKS